MELSPLLWQMDQHRESEGGREKVLPPSFNNIIVFGFREDRWERCKEILEKEGIERVTRYKTEKTEDKYTQTTREFLRMLRIKGENDLVFFEDDFELTDGWKDVVTRAWKDLPSDWDMLYLGINLTKSPQRITENLLRVRGGWCMHGVVISSRFSRFILDRYDPNCRQVIDEWMRIIAPERKFYMTYPMVCYQRRGYSDYVGKDIFYDLFNNKYYLTV